MKEFVKLINKIFKYFSASLKNKLGKIMRSGSYKFFKAEIALGIVILNDTLMSLFTCSK